MQHIGNLSSAQGVRSGHEGGLGDRDAQHGGQLRSWAAKGAGREQE